MKRTIYILTLLFVAKISQAQKLPNVQEKSILAPIGIKIDGKPAEWKNMMQATNSATDLTYVMSNDGENLYLVVQATEAANKILMAGIDLQIYKGGKKDVKNKISVAYPIFDKGKRESFNWATRFAGEGVPSDELVNKRIDSIMQIANAKLTTLAKWIAVKGIPGTDSVISVYNNEGFKAASAFDNKKVLTCEIAISLKNLGLSADDAAKFAYHVVLNGGNNKARTPIIYGATMADGTPMPQAQLEAAQGRLAAMFASTDFWGEYTLAKP